MKKKEHFVILIDYDNCSTEYVSCSSKADLDWRLTSLKQNSSVEYIEVIAPQTISTWSNPNCSPEEDF
jgi:hypothetical protein